MMKLIINLKTIYTLIVVISFLTVIIDALQNKNLNYSIIESTGKFCPGRDSCRQTRNTRDPDGVEIDWKKRNCFCDNACSMFGDCCIDAPSYDKEQQMKNIHNFECTNLKQYRDIYIRKTCHENWNIPHVKEGCENSSQVRWVVAFKYNPDPFGSIPVTNIFSGVTYANYQCALCNNESFEKIRFWRPRIECPTLTFYSNRFGNLTSNYIANNLIFKESSQQWGIEVYFRGVPVFHECIIDPAVPNDIIGKIRECSGKNIISDCPKGYDNDQIRDYCRSYTALIFEPNASYRNVHCAICHKADLKRLICLNLGPYGRFNWQQNFNSFSFAVLFDITGDQESKVGFITKCKEGELFDPFSKKCRNVVCTEEQQVFQNGRCVHPNTDNDLINVSSLTSSTQETTTTSSTTTTTLQKSSSTTTILSSTSTTSTSSSSEASTNNPSESLKDNSQTFPNISNEIIDDYEEEIITHPEIIVKNMEENENIDYNLTHNEITNSIPDAEFLTCPKFELNSNEFQFMYNNTVIYVSQYDKIFNDSDFQFNSEKNTVFICADHGYSEDIKFGAALGYLTFICLVISVISCILHILISCLTWELQNLNSKNLLALTIALLGGYLTFLSAMFVENPNVEIEEKSNSITGCYSLAMIMYYFFVASFIWMLIIAFDVYRTLKLATTQLRFTSGIQWKKYLLYSSIGWCLPMIFLIITVICDQMLDSDNQYHPGFGMSQICWFTNKKALLVFFGSPFIFTQCCNLFLFISSGCMIYQTGKESSRVTSSASNSNTSTHTNFSLYLKLSILMGITWITGLIGSALNIEPIWYIFVLLNGLQGLFIFIAFTCTKKVWKCLKNRMKNSNYYAEDSSKKWIGSSGNGTSTTSTRSESSGIFTSQGKTIYTVSDYQASNALTQNSFNGRYI